MLLGFILPYDGPLFDHTLPLGQRLHWGLGGDASLPVGVLRGGVGVDLLELRRGHLHGERWPTLMHCVCLWALRLEQWRDGVLWVREWVLLGRGGQRMHAMRFEHVHGVDWLDLLRGV